MASPEGFEPSTARLEGVCSIQLSYEDSMSSFFEEHTHYTSFFLIIQYLL